MIGHSPKEVVAKPPAGLTELEYRATAPKVSRSSWRLGFEIQRVKWEMVWCFNQTTMQPKDLAT